MKEGKVDLDQREDVDIIKIVQTKNIMPEKENIKYKEFSERPIDYQYHNLLKKLKKEGIKKTPIHARLVENSQKNHQSSYELTGEVLSYNLENGFPVLTERDLSKSFKGCLGELVAFLNGAHTLEDLKKYGCPEIFWKDWVTKEKCAQFNLSEGDLGLGSYGASLARFHTRDGNFFDQVTAILNNILKAPYLRTHVISTWNPPYSMGDEDQGIKREVVVAPCHGNFVHFILFDEQKELQVTHTQRSADVPVGLQFNIIQWSAIGLMLAYLLDYKYTKYTHFISNPHYYDIQTGAIDELLSRGPKQLPTVKLVPKGERKRIQDFRVEDFELSDYFPHEGFRINTPI